MYRSSHISFEDFLEEVEHRIKELYGNRTRFGKVIGKHRNTIGKVLNDPQKLNPYWINVFASELGLDLRYFVFY